MIEKKITPVDDAYWVVPGQLLAGGHPMAFGSEARRRARLLYLLGNGMTYFVNLTEPGEKGLELYAPLLKEVADEMGVKAEYQQMPIPDFDITSRVYMKQILKTIDTAIEKGDKVYLHCFAGIGRTGMVAGCYLAEHGFPGIEALEELYRLKQGTSFEGESLPVTPEQRAMVQNWHS